MCRVITLMSTGGKLTQHRFFLDNVQFDSKTVKPHTRKNMFPVGYMLDMHCFLFLYNYLF